MNKASYKQNDSAQKARPKLLRIDGKVTRVTEAQFQLARSNKE